MNAVFTNDLRVTFVEGHVAGGSGGVLCGPNSEFSIELTLLQAEELLYRVKRAGYTAGSLSITGIGAGDGDISAPTSDTGNRMIEVDTDTRKRHGYVTPDGDVYNDADYDAGIGNMFSEIGSNENGLWQPVWNKEGDSLVYPFEEFTDAFRFYQTDPAGVKAGDSEWFGYPTTAEGGVTARAFRGHRIAVVRDDPADGFYASTNRFFLEFEFYLFNHNPPVCYPNLTTLDCYLDPGGFFCTLYGSLPANDTDYGIKFSGYFSTPGVSVDLSWDAPGEWHITLSGAVSEYFGGWDAGGGSNPYTDKCTPNPIDLTGITTPPFQGYYWDGSATAEINIYGDQSVCVPSGTSSVGVSTNAVTGRLGDFDSSKYEVCNYIIRLATGDISCPVYSYLDSSSLSGTDFIHEPSLWCEFAKNSPAEAVYDSYTGAPL